MMHINMLCSYDADVGARSFYEPILVTEFICKFFNVRDLNRPLGDSDRVKVYTMFTPLVKYQCYKIGCNCLI